MGQIVYKCPRCGKETSWSYEGNGNLVRRDTGETIPDYFEDISPCFDCLTVEDLSKEC